MAALSSSCSFIFLLLLLLVLFTSPPAALARRTRFLHLNFYLHEINLGVPNSTMIFVVNENRSNGFGDVVVYDNVFRAGVSPDSPLLGREQGLGVGSNLQVYSGLTALEFFFTTGRYNGSSFAVFGRVPAGGISDRTIIGGTGRFRMARGYILGSVAATTNTTTTWEMNAYIAAHRRPRH
ncbi:dirigent protein 22-like [Curcuma longa]|uniref:dirigent protein 22-like n=1 Tax=Curcuma longa TaxID=136217 RepID=UPI003D9ED77A